MRTTTLRKYIKEKSDARISKTAILHIRNSIETFIDKLNRQLLIDRSGKSEKTITATQEGFQLFFSQKKRYYIFF